ncbi:mobilization protein [Rhizobium ruizarguesonis]|uniref:mobilization protein n=1 Tax=Rhizobium ruizarguesonis TaxID=2081791 RepID=UPI00102FFF67|nr:mobilization protein [Rhizobium ruizarguesonis]NKL10858.1 mobilization protein [Rhizobium leguminosarum bv. viciae]NEJ03633.1 mobilization protein [Rhizobium ruizarguesonis]NEJ40714.1 mobilization protein [Rhizobium ruizarguesonis]TAT91714.1 mobilization protein [Rhizobium ruizarguesonis]TAZ03655.1 mobilization protein [Rhizobium ruizarguesonis]
MARKSIGERLAQLEAQRRTLQIRLSKQERAIDTRRKVLIGALVLHRLEHDREVQIGGGLAEWLRRELPKFLTRDGDRDLFDDLLKPQANEPSIGNIGSGSAV